jgi:hypothetical protein
LTCEKLPRATTLIKEEIEEETGRISFGNRFKFQQNGGTQVLCFQTGAANPKTVMDSMGHSDIKTTIRYTHGLSKDPARSRGTCNTSFLRHSAAALEA